MPEKLLNKYNVPGPRYTSYPTVPYWDIEQFSVQKWKDSLLKAYNKTNTTQGISLYIHLPFCESLCTFCGCNKRITKQHDVEQPYIKQVLKEWGLYVTLLKTRPVITEIHLGGGTPTFFTPEHLQQLIKGILAFADLADNYEFSFEGHPNNTTKLHLQTLYNLGFTRVSYGVQDYNETVQKAINRNQTFQQVKKVTQWAREIGYTSVSHDIIFGLPFQTQNHIKSTITKTNNLKPDRLAFYSYAHVPWIKGNGQRGFKDSDLPHAQEKRNQYELGKKLLAKNGYVEIGMDHFAMPSDNLYKAMKTGALHRNFMGYTSSKTKVMIGLGVSSISDSWYGFSQNVKDLKQYYQKLNENELPIFRGHILSEKDLIIRKHILNLMCKFKTTWEHEHMFFEELPETVLSLKEMEADGILNINHQSIEVTEKGKPFVRNVCMAFDVLLKAKQPETKLFSMTI